MNFTKIGVGRNTTTKKGKPAIRLTLDPKAREVIYKEDFESKVWLFETFEGDWVVFAPMKDDYEYVATKR